MATFLITEIEWDCDGYDPVADCNLPMTILVVDAPDTYMDDDFQDNLSEALSDVYGFCHGGFRSSPIQGDRVGRHTPIKIDAIMESPE